MHIYTHKEKLFCLLTNDIIRLYGKKQFRNYGCMNGRGNYDMEKLAGTQHLDREIYRKEHG